MTLSIFDFCHSRLLTAALLVSAVALAVWPSPAAGQAKEFDCSQAIPTAPTDPYARTRENTVCFDHDHLRPTKDSPTILRIKNGEYFHVVIGNTDPTLFTYSVTAIPKAESTSANIGATGSPIEATRRDWTAVSMLHSDAFVKYRVVIAVRAGITPTPTRGTAADVAGGRGGRRGGRPRVTQLQPATFDIFVNTKPGVEVSFTGGVAFSGLRSPQFFTKTDDKGTAATTDDTKTVEEDVEARDRFRPDTIAVTNIRDPNKFGGVGLAFGVGLNNDADPRYFFGPSYFLGKNVLLHAGWTGGRVDRLPNGQQTGKAPINGDNTLAELPKRFKHGFYVGISFAFIPNAQKNFVAAFGASQDTGESEEEAAEPEAGEGGAVDNSKWAGDYKSADGKKTATAAINNEKRTLTLTGDDFDAAPGSVLTSSAQGSAKTYSGVIEKQKKAFTCSLIENTDKTLAIECVDEAGATKLTYKKNP